MRLQDAQAARLKRYARALGKSLGEVSALLIEEQLRVAEFAFIEFRPSPAGRQAYMKGSRLTVWWVVNAVSQAGMDAEQAAAHFRRPAAWVKAALNYYEAFPEEIDQAIADHRATGFENLRRALPLAQSFDVAIGDAE
jgi:uncharacterized protein (DUF433 family)